MPAVSTSSSPRPSTSIGVSIASRVVPAMSETITRSRPRNALTSEDLPTFGRPITASRTRSSSASALLVLGQQLDEPVEQVAGAEALGGGDGDRLAQPEAVEVVGEREVARRVDLVRGEHDRQVAAAQHVGDLLVARPQPGAGVDHEQRDLASASAARAWSWIETASGSSSSRSTPPVSISVKLRPFHSVSSSLRSRVMPGRSCTTASRDCVRRLTSEDLPTFG